MTKPSRYSPGISWRFHQENRPEILMRKLTWNLACAVSCIVSTCRHTPAWPKRSDPSSPSSWASRTTDRVFSESSSLAVTVISGPRGSTALETVLTGVAGHLTDWPMSQTVAASYVENRDVAHVITHTRSDARVMAVYSHLQRYSPNAPPSSITTTVGHSLPWDAWQVIA